MGVDAAQHRVRVQYPLGEYLCRKSLPRDSEDLLTLETLGRLVSLAETMLCASPDELASLRDNKGAWQLIGARLGSDMPSLRASALHDLSYVAEKGDNLAVSLVIARLKDKMAAVRGVALEVLETLALKGDERVVEAVVAACGDNADAIRINAARVHLELTQQLFTESAGIADGPDNAAAAARNAAPPRAPGSA